MECTAIYDIESDTSITSDDVRLTIQHPENRFRAFIRNTARSDFSTPFVLSLQLTFQGDSLEQAREIHLDRLAECLNFMALTTGASLSLLKTKQIIDCTPTSGLRQCLMWVDSFGNDDPSPSFDAELIASINHLLRFDPPPAIRRAMRWYRLGCASTFTEDQFQYFWFALEIVAEYQKSTEKVHDNCPDCKKPLYCQTCDTYPKHRPFAVQAIRELIAIADPACDEKTVKALFKTRNDLMHGASVTELPKVGANSDQEIVDVLGRIVFMSLIRQFPRELLETPIRAGVPTTYIRRTMGGIVLMSTVVPIAPDGEVDTRVFSGMKAEMIASRPPQSALPSGVVISKEQFDRLGRLAYLAGEKQELCKRVYDHVQTHGEQKVAVLFATDLKVIDAALARGETGNWQDLFREILVRPSADIGGEPGRSK